LGLEGVARIAEKVITSPQRSASRRRESRGEFIFLIFYFYLFLFFFFFLIRAGSGIKTNQRHHQEQHGS
jgi:hypothetical protein